MAASLDLIRNPGFFSQSCFPEMVPDTYATDGVHDHALPTCQVGARCFVSMYIQVPGSWSVKQGHDLMEDIERDIHQVLPPVTVFTNIELLRIPTRGRVNVSFIK
jgi:divalent metal cation (Fe/Co/Zn/Cd) transporter